MLCVKSSQLDDSYSQGFFCLFLLEQEQMDTQINQTENLPTPAVVSSSCRKFVKDDNATFLANLKDQINEFVHASMDEHKTCFQNSMNKVLSQLSISPEKSHSLSH